MILVDPPEAPFEIIYDADTSDTLLNIVPPAGSQRMYLNAPGDKLDGWNKKKQTGSHTVWSTRNSDYDTGVVGTVRVLNEVSDGIYLTNVDGSKKGLHLLPDGISVDKDAHTITEEFTIVNDGAGTDVTVIDPMESGWDESYSSGGTITYSNGTATNTTVSDSSGRTAIRKKFNDGYLSGKTFIKFTITASVNCTLYAFILDGTSTTYKYWSGPRFALTANVPSTFTLPILAPPGITGSNPSALFETGGAFDLSIINRLYIGVSGLTSEAAVTYSVRDVTSCNGTWAQVEVAVPDKLLNLYAETYPDSYRVTGNSWRPSNNDWSSVRLFHQYTDGGLDANTGYGYFLDGSKINETYGAASATASDGAAIYDGGIAGGTGVRGKYCTTYAPPAVQYSDTGGTPRRIALAILMPPTGGIAGFNQIQLKMGIYYDDDNGMYVPDLSGCGNHGAIVGGVTKLNGGGLVVYDNSACVSIPGFHPNTYFHMKIDVTIGDSNLNWIWFACDGANPTGVQLCLSDINNKYTAPTLRIGSTYAQSSLGVLKNTRYTIDAYYKPNRLEIWLNGVLKGSYDGAITLTPGTANVFKLGAADYYASPLKKLTVHEFKYEQLDASGNVVSTQVHYKPAIQNMGSTTFEFTPQSRDHFTGLDNVGNWIAFERPDKRAEVFLFSRKLPSLSVTEDENGYITNIEVGVKKGTKVARSWVRYPDFDADGNSDDVPNFIDKIVEQLQNKFAFTRKYTNEVDLSGMAVVANDFSIDLQTANPVYPVSSGSKVYDSQGNLLTPVETITTADGNLDLVEVYGKPSIRVFGDENLNYGECKVWDTVTAGNTTESTWLRVYDVNHVFTGDTVIENGILRFKSSSIVEEVSPATVMYIRIDDGTYTYFGYPYSIGSYGNTFIITGISGISTDSVNFSLSSRRVVSPYTVGEYVLSADIERGKMLAYMEFEGPVPGYTMLRYRSDASALYNSALYDRFYLSPSVLTDSKLTSGWSGELSQYVVGISTIYDFVRVCTNPKTGKLRAYPGATTAEGLWQIGTYNPTTGFHFGAIPYSQQMYWEAEACPSYGSSTVAEVDAYDGYAKEIRRPAEYSNYLEVLLKDICTAGIEYTALVRVKCTKAGQLILYTFASGFGVTATSTPTVTIGSYAYYSLKFTPAAGYIGLDSFKLYIKNTCAIGEDAPINIDYILIVPTELIEKHAKRALVNLNEVKTYKEV